MHKNKKSAKSAAKKSPAKRAYHKHATFETTSGLLEIEREPPAIIRGITAEKLAFYSQLKRTIEAIKVGQAFIIKTEQTNTAKTWLTREDPAHHYRFFVIVDNKEKTRVYKTDPTKKG
jgi:hypothetical protein